MKLCFDSIQEIKEFVAGLKGTRGGKGKDDGDADSTLNQAPPPLQPPTGQQPAFNPAQGATFTPPAGFPGTGGADPALQAIVARIVARIDSAIQSGQPADAVLTWFRSRCGAEAANATMDQIKQNFLPKLSMPSLEDIARLMNA